jgi:hypothetical protein
MSRKQDTERSFVAAVLLASHLVVAACDNRCFLAKGRAEGGTARSLASQPSASRIIGTWQSDAYVSQLGQTVETICFLPGGKVKSALQTQAGRLQNRGTYEVGNEQVRLIWEGTGQVAVGTILWKGSYMLLTNDRHKTTRYRRVSGGC